MLELEKQPDSELFIMGRRERISFRRIQFNSEMETGNKLPDWLVLWIWRALLGEIYPDLRAIAVSFSEDKTLKVRYYLDREPTDFDYESLGYVMTSILSEASSNDEIARVSEECEYSVKPISELDSLDGIVYARREYDL